MNITKFLRTPFFKDYLRWLLLLFFYFSNEMSCIDIRLKRDIHMLFYIQIQIHIQIINET